MNNGKDLGSLTTEIRNPGSPVRRFLDERFSHGMHDVQRLFLKEDAALVVPGNDANPGTVPTNAGRVSKCPQSSRSMRMGLRFEHQFRRQTCSILPWKVVCSASLHCAGHRFQCAGGPLEEALGQRHRAGCMGIRGCVDDV
jgi:hypothetical protein